MTETASSSSVLTGGHRKGLSLAIIAVAFLIVLISFASIPSDADDPLSEGGTFTAEGMTYKITSSDTVIAVPSCETAVTPDTVSYVDIEYSYSNVTYDAQGTDFVCIDNLRYDKVDGKDELILAGFLQDAAELNMPSSVTVSGVEYKVTAIKEDAFSSSALLKSAVISQYVTSIGNNAFYECDRLLSVVLPDGLMSIGGKAFGDCPLLRSIYIPDSVVSIGYSAFNGCSSMTSIHLSSGLNEIGNLVLSRCASLTVVDIPDGVTAIGGYAFYKCCSLSSIDIPDGTVSIGECAFSNCTSLRTVSIPESVSSIGDYAFELCSSLNCIDVDEANEHYCSSEGVLFNNDSTVIIQYPTGWLRTSYTIPDSVTSIGPAAFKGCRLVSVVIPDNVVTIANSAFESCATLTSVTVGSSVNTVEDNAFYMCMVLVEVCNKSSLEITKGSADHGYIAYHAVNVCSDESESILKYQFIEGNSMAVYYIDGVRPVLATISETLSDLVFPESLGGRTYYIGDYAFADRSNLVSVTATSGVKGIGDYAFSGCSSLESVDTGSDLTGIGAYAFSGCSSLKTFHIGKLVSSIGNRAFYSCSLTEITVSDENNHYASENGVLFNKEMTELIQYPSGSTSLSYTIPDGVVKVDAFSFRGSSSLIALCVPSSLESIGANAFSDCFLLVEIENNSSLEMQKGSSSNGGIARYALNICTSETRTTILKIQWMSDTSCAVFYDIGSGAVLLTVYDTGSEFCLPETLSSYSKYSIHDHAFYGNKTITSVSIPNGVTSIGESAFEGCVNIRYVYNQSDLDIMKGTESNGHVAYYASDVNFVCIDGLRYDRNGTEVGIVGCNDEVTDLTVQDTVTVQGTEYKVTSIGVAVFEGCTGLASVTIGANVVSIGDAAFSRCTSLTSLVLPDNVITIGDGTFYGCISLASVTVGIGVSSFGRGAFSGCTTLGTITVDNEEPASLGESAFFGCPGSMKVFVPLVGNADYKDASGWSELNIISYTDAPSAAEGLIYSGGSQTGVPASGYGAYSVSDNVKKDAGSYTATATLNDGFLWTGGATDVKEIEWSISCRTVTVSGITADDKEYDGDTGASLDYTGMTIDGKVEGDDLSAEAVGTFDVKDAGTGRTVTITDITLVGTSAKNYELSSTEHASVKADITPKEVTIDGLSAEDKVYDGTTNVKITGTPILSWIFESDDVDIEEGSAEFSSKDVGTSIPVIFTGYSLSGEDSDNYSLIDQPSADADITPREVTIINIAADEKVYDGTTNVKITGTPILSWIFESDDVDIEEGSAEFSSKDVGTSIPVIFTGYSLSGDDSGNYSLTEQPSTVADIVPKEVTIDGLSAEDKVYDGTTNVKIIGTPELSWSFESDDVDIEEGSAEFSSKDAGISIPVIFTGYTLSGEDSDNYSLTEQPSTVADIVPKEVTIDGLSAEDKVYDGTTMVNITGTPELSWISDGDNVVIEEGSAEFSSKDVGTSIPVIFTGYTLSGDDSGNYSLTEQSTADADITPKEVTISGIIAEDKVYDGTTKVKITGTPELSWIADGDEVIIIDGSAEFSSKDAGTEIPVIFTGYSLSGDDSGNYSLTEQPTADADITPKEVTISGIIAEDKVYDGSTDVSLDCSEVTITGLIFGDIITVTAIGEFIDADAGKDKIVNISDMTLIGESAGNYEIASSEKDIITADITSREVTVSGIAAADKVYDGDTEASLDYTGVTIDGMVEGDDLSAEAVGTFDGKDAGTGRTVTITDIVLTGVSAKNYELSSSEQASVTADILPKEVTVSGILAEDKVYDRSVAASLDCSEVTIIGLIFGDIVTVTATGEFTDVNAGNDRVVDISEITLSGESAGNYSVSDDSQSSAVADIMPKEVTVSGILAEDKVYDGNISAVLVMDNVLIDGYIDGDELSVRAEGAFATKDADIDKTVNIFGMALAGASADNYTLAETGQQTSATADITPLPITSGEIVLGPSLTYNGKEQTQTVECVVLQDHSVTFTVSDNIVTDAGEYVLTAIGTGNFTGELEKGFTVAKASNEISVGRTASCIDVIYNVDAKALGTPEFTYSIQSGDDVISVDGNGTVTGKAVGTAKLMVSVLEQRNYLPASKVFDISVYDHSPETVPGKIPTKTESGLTEGSVCSECGKTLTEQITIAPTGSETSTVVSSDPRAVYEVPNSSDVKTIDIVLNGTSADSRATVRLSGSAAESVKGKVIDMTVEKVSGKDDTYSAVFRVDGKELTGEMRITLQYDPAKGAPSVRWVEGGQDMDIISVNESDRTVTFVTTHNSTYQIEYESQSGAAVICLWAVVAVLGAILFGSLLVRTRP